MTGEERILGIRDKGNAVHLVEKGVIEQRDLDDPARPGKRERGEREREGMNKEERKKRKKEGRRKERYEGRKIRFCVGNGTRERIRAGRRERQEQ